MCMVFNFGIKGVSLVFLRWARNYNTIHPKIAPHNFKGNYPLDIANAYNLQMHTITK